MKLILLILFFSTPLFAQTNFITAPDGTHVDASTDYGFYLAGLLVGLGFYGVGMAIRMGKRTAGGSYD